MAKVYIEAAHVFNELHWYINRHYFLAFPVQAFKLAIALTHCNITLLASSEKN